MDLDLLPTLVALADTGSLTLAGRRRGLSQPAVHQQLARLAEQVGHPLYRREGRALVLSAAGERLVGLGRRILGDRDATLAALRGQPGALAVVCAGRGVWLHRVEAFTGLVPLVADGPGTVAAVREGRAQLGIAAVPAPEDLRSVEVAAVGTVLAAPAGHPLAAGPRGWEDLRGADWVLPPRGRALRERVEARCGPCAVRVEAEGWDLLLRFVQLGAGVTLVNEGVPLPDGVVGVPLADAPPVVYRALWHPRVDGEALLALLTWRRA